MRIKSQLENNLKEKSVGKGCLSTKYREKMKLEIVVILTGLARCSLKEEGLKTKKPLE